VLADSPRALVIVLRAGFAGSRAWVEATTLRGLLARVGSCT